jgi:copper transport protein
MTLSPLEVACRRTAAILAAAIVMFLVGAAPASAHGELERSDPPNGGMVEIGRSTLNLWFTDAIISDASSFDLRTEGGAEVDVTVSVSEAEGGGVVRIEAEPLAKGTYVLDWKVLSLDDGHSSTGSVLFGVGTRPVAVAAEGSGLPGAPGLLLRWLDLLAIMLAIGALAVSGRVLGSMGEPGTGPRRRARLVAAVAAGVAVVSGAVIPFIGTHRSGGSLGIWFDATSTTLLRTPWGHLWLAREIALVIAAAALWSWARRRNDWGRPRIAVVALVGVAWLESSAGHASSLPGRSGLAAIASASHLVAAGVWAGGLIVLVLCLLPMMRLAPDTRGPSVASAWRAYSPIAATAAVVLVATGLYQSGRHVPDLSSVTSTVYGGGVLGKVVLVAGALALAGVNTMLVNPGLASRVGRVLGKPVGWTPVPLRRFTTVLAAEAAVLVVATGYAALLTSVPTARELGTATAATAPYTSNVGGLFVTFEEVPAGPDQSRIIVQARSTLKPEPGRILGVVVVLNGPSGTTSSVSLEPVGPGRYEAQTPAPGRGAWSASVAVQRAGLPDAVTKVDWTVAARTDDRVRPLEVATTALALLMLTALVAAFALIHRHRRQQPTRLSPLVGEKAGSSR